MVKRFATLLLPLALILAACQSAPTGGGNNTTPRANRTRVPTEAATQADSGTAAPAPTTASTDSAASTSQPTLDLQGYILTQAYSNFTPMPQATLVPQPTNSAATHASSSGSEAGTSGVPLDTPTQGFAAPASVIVSGPVSIAGGINQVTCVIDGVGDCTTVVPQGDNVYFTWSFGVQGSQAFKWGDAAVVVQKDGQQFKWFQANNSALPPPADGQIAILAVGDRALFRGGVDKVQPGTYTAKLEICLGSVEQCNAGTGWQDVGGDTVRFVVNS